MRLIFNNSNIIFSICLCATLFLLLLVLHRKSHIIIVTTSGFIYLLYYTLFAVLKDTTTFNLVLMLRPDLIIEKFSPYMTKLVNYRPSKAGVAFENMKISSICIWLKTIIQNNILNSPIYFNLKKIQKLSLIIVRINCQRFYQIINAGKESYQQSQFSPLVFT